MHINKKDICKCILDDLIDSGMVALDCGSELYDQYYEDALQVILRRLDGYVVIDGQVVE